MLASGCVLRRAAECAADGLLCAGADRARRARPWRRGPAGLHQRLALGLHAGADRRRRSLRGPAGPAHGARPGQHGRRRDRRRARRPAVRLGRRSLAPRRRAGRRRWSRLAEADAFRAIAGARPARGALGDQGAARRAAAAVCRGRGARERDRPGSPTSRPWRCGR